jgi:2-polyprenyl-3-methyl-5-hydroxy-6-metoxy-1,4-benzoquinol methylase
MNADQREAVVSNAKYLREVRPIDPDEITEYVEGQPHPAAIRQVLREEALALGLREREDGTFEPVPEAPVAVDFDGVDAFPNEYAMALEELLVAEYGAGWVDGETGDAIRERIRRLKTDYLWNNDVEYDYETALAYACYHLPDYYATVQYVLAVLADDDLLPRTLRVLDVGAGVGGPALGLHDLLPEDALVEYHAVEPSDAADVLSAMLDETGRNFHTTVHRTTAESFEPEGEYDLVLFGNVLSELDDPAAVVERYEGALADAGTVVAIAPADRETAINLREVERAVENELTVYAPTCRLWPDERPTDEGWSFDRRPDIEVPNFQRRLDEGERAVPDPDHEPGEFVSVDVQYAYGLWRPDGRERVAFTPDASRYARMADMEAHVTERIDCVAIKLSHDLSEGDDANPVYKIGDGSQRESHYAVLTKESALNRSLEAAAYGDLLVFENVLALWNDDEYAYNLVVDAETVVDHVPASE